MAVANIVERGHPTRDTFHNVILVWIASIAIGYIVEVARASEATLARALEIEAATRERERLARDIHDSVLQVLAMVQRRGSALGGEAAELGRMAGEQEVALRTLVSSGLVPPGPGVRGRRERRRASGPSRSDDEPDDGAGTDLRSLLAPHAGSKVSFAEPGAPVLLAAPAARELAAAVSAALDNVRRHAGESRPGLDPGRGLGGRGDRDGTGRRPRHPGGPARARPRGRDASASPSRSGAGCGTWAARRS